MPYDEVYELEDINSGANKRMSLLLLVPMM